MKLLVTGGAGFIGSNFVHHILEKYTDYEVITLDALTYAGNLENLARWEKDPRHTFVKGNITDAELVDGLITKCQPRLSKPTLWGHKCSWKLLVNI